MDLNSIGHGVLSVLPVKSRTMTREEAHRLLEEWVQDGRLKRHLFSTAYAMAAYAEKFGEDPEKWYITGLLHDGEAAEELGVPFEEHVQFVLSAMQAHAEEIGL